MQESKPRDDRRSLRLPAARILSNGRYTVSLTSVGTGSSRLGAIALSEGIGGRRDLRGGLDLLLRDRESGLAWPVGVDGDAGAETDYMAVWTAGSARLSGRREGIASEQVAVVHPDHDVELHRVRIKNLGRRPRRLELSAYLEPVLLPARAHEAHPAFSKLFLQTEWREEARALIVRRRRRAPEDDPPCLLLSMPGVEPVSHESDRSRLLPRAAGVQAARLAPALAELTGRTGSVLDPALCLRRELHLEPGRSVELLVLVGATRDAESMLPVLARLAAPGGFDGVLDGAMTSQLHMLAELGLTGDQAGYLELLGAALIMDHSALRPWAAPVRPPVRADKVRDRLGLDRERPFILADEGRMSAGDLFLLRRGQLYWQALALPLDLVVLGAADQESRQPGVLDGSRRLSRERLTAEDLLVLGGAAALSLRDRLPDLIAVQNAPETGRVAKASDAGAVAEGGDLRFFNGYGGFDADGREYVIRMKHGNGKLHLPPRPWTNVIANETFGFLVSETGAGMTWRGNSREHRLTPWSNDPILDPHGEAFYLRDEESGRFWSPLPGPVPAAADYEMRHGIGYSRCTVSLDGLDHETVLFAAQRDPLRLTRIRLHNSSRRKRRLSLWAYYELSLGAEGAGGTRHLVTSPGGGPGELRATRGGPIAFAAVIGDGSANEASGSGDRGAFLGERCDVSAPAALLDGRLEVKTGAHLDSCFAQRVALELEPGGDAEVCFLFGEADGEAEIESIRRAHGDPERVRRALEDVRQSWRSFCDRLQVSTPAPELDILVNGWLPYQTLGCRILGRSAFYQSGGAFGFRDQLQDAASLLMHDPGLVRRQILLNAAHQFEAGDVMHWWHPLIDIGIRTRFADDLLWLPLLTAEYLTATGDAAILAVEIDFLRGRPLAPGEDEALLPVEAAGDPADLYEHCCRTVDRSLGTGANGLPLFGCGDWNDGMNRVGRGGRGESVWMGFFLASVLDAWLPFVAERGDDARHERYRLHRQALAAALETAGWDGDWYRRGYYDDGTPLGSRGSDECRIDALVQAWSVLSGAADPGRAERALASAEEHLISESDGLIRLLAPPFDSTGQDPGYIKGYVPGVRENGGQYTHAALWVVRAFAKLGRRDRVAGLLALLNPINHSDSPEAADRYQVEPYVVAADVYGVPPHVGRGGWTWYTGSSGWMLRVAVESLLGFHVEGGSTGILSPCIPDDWPRYEIGYRPDDAGTLYRIAVENPRLCSAGLVSCSLDGEEIGFESGECRFPLEQDGREHVLILTLGPAPGGAS